MIFSWIVFIQATQTMLYPIQYPGGLPVANMVLSLSAEDVAKKQEQLWTTDLSNVKEIDISNLQADAFLYDLVTKNSTLVGLQKINASNTDIELDTLKAIRAMRAKFLVRDLPQYSERFQRSVATITVDIAGTQLSNSDALEYSVVEQPISFNHTIHYRCGLPSENGAIQIIVKK